MDGLRSYCTVALRTRKCLYLNFYSTNFNNFFFNYSLVCILLTVKISSFLAAVAYAFSKQERSKWALFGPPIDENHSYRPTILNK